jgi:hypothetical protein
VDSEAVVLKFSGRKLSLLSKTKGRIERHFYLQKSWMKLSSGSLIKYAEGNNKNQLESLSVEYVPLFCGRRDIIFLHSFIEICNFFIPEGSGGTLFYSFMISIYKHFIRFDSLYLQKRALCKALAHLGIHPEHKQFYPYVHFLLEIPIDNLATTDIQLLKEEILDQWLLWCIDSHPQGKWFKAIPFLLKE